MHFLDWSCLAATKTLFALSCKSSCYETMLSMILFKEKVGHKLAFVELVSISNKKIRFGFHHVAEW